MLHSYTNIRDPLWLTNAPSRRKTDTPSREITQTRNHYLHSLWQYYPRKEFAHSRSKVFLLEVALFFKRFNIRELNSCLQQCLFEKWRQNLQVYSFKKPSQLYDIYDQCRLRSACASMQSDHTQSMLVPNILYGS